MLRRSYRIALSVLAFAWSCAPAKVEPPNAAPVVKSAEAAKSPDVGKPPAPARFDGTIGGWEFQEKTPMCSFAVEPKVTAEHSIKVVDALNKDGSNTYSAPVCIEGGERYRISWQVYPVFGSGLGIYAQFLNAKGEVVGSENTGNPDAPLKTWIQRDLVLEPPAGATALRVLIHSYDAAIVTAYLDDFRIEKLPPAPSEPRWKGSYKIKPEEKARLTEADFPGPDGVVYPDWTWAGIRGGIPTVAVKATAEEFGAKPDDEGDDSAALQKALDALAEKGGGALAIGPGTFLLDRTLVVESDNVVIRGAGRDKTKLILRYKDGPTQEAPVRFFSPEANAAVDRNTRIELHCWPDDLMRMAVYLDDKLLGERTRTLHWGATFSMGVGASSFATKTTPGKHVLKGVAEYRDGKTFEAKIEVTMDPASSRPQRAPNSQAAICFRGRGYDGKKFELAEDGRRGSREVLLAVEHDLKPGDRIFLTAPATERWKTLTENKCKWGSYRDYWFVVEDVKGGTVRLNQPLRIEYPKIDGAYVQKWRPILRCGVEDLYLEHTSPFWMSGVMFANAWECWARNLHIQKAGRNPLDFTAAKWCETRNCVLDDAWFHGGGGTAYVGWWHSCDCLMEDCKVSRMRHGPCVQWAAVGNVIRNCAFDQSDGQWHAGWSTENLFENCVIDARTGMGSYGFGFWGSPPHDEAHGPEGPRNVIYNCDAKSPKGSLWMGGMNENWLILYNRFFAETGPSVFARCASFDHIIRGNVLILKDAKEPAIVLKDKDCVGVEVYDNTILGGNGKLCGGKASPVVDRGNKLLPFGESPRPKPLAPSIFEWQRQNRPRR